VLRQQYDFHNLKVAIREKVSGRDLGHLYIDLGRFDAAEDIKKPIDTDNLEKLPKGLAEAAAEALEAYSRSSDPAQTDLAIERTMFSRFLSVVRDFGVVYIQAIVRTWIDLANIRAFMRARYLGLEARAFPEMLFEGGFHRLSDFEDTYSLQTDEVLQRFEFSPYKRILEVGGGALEKHDSFSQLEREIDTYMMSFLRLSRYFTFGLEVVLSYAVLKHTELRVLRLILAGKQSGMRAEGIKERIPDGQ
jgi:V/A-type H+-transporting ATPase subunit C